MVKSFCKRFLLILLATVLLLGGCQTVETSKGETVTVSAAQKAALKAFKKRDYKKAYQKAKRAKDMSDENRKVIEECYVEEYLIKEKGAFYDAKELLDTLDWTDMEKDVLLERYGNLQMCQVGNVARFGKIDFDPVEWIVMTIDEMEIEGKKHRVAQIITRDIIGSPDGWGTRTTEYAISDLHCWCETSFKLQLRVNLNETEEKSVLYTEIETDGKTALARCFAPSKEELEKYLVGDLERYRIATPTQDARLQGVATMNTTYYLRNIGKNENGIQYACGVNAKGEIGERYGRSVRAIGGRVCLRVELGVI